MKSAFSYSEFYLWNKSRSEYVKKYIEGEPSEPEEWMILGTEIHSAIESETYPIVKTLKEKGFRNKTYIVKKLLDRVQRASEREVYLTADLLGNQLCAVPDGIDRAERVLYEYKTTGIECRLCKKSKGIIKFYILADDPENLKPYHPSCVVKLEVEIIKEIDRKFIEWSQKKVDTNDQLSFYSLIWSLKNFSYFREIILQRLDTTNGMVKTYYTVRSRRDNEYIEERIMKTIGAIKAEGLWEKRLSRAEQEQKRANKLV